MALKLLAPGSRKGNKFWLARGSIGGRVYEVSTNTTDEKAARRFARDFAAKLRAEPAGPRTTFAEAAQRYVEFRNPSRADRQRIDRAVRELGAQRIRELNAAALHEAALRMFPAASPATRNREALRPIITVLHHASAAGLCDWIRVRAFKEPRPVTRALDGATAARLIEAAPAGPKRLLLVWLFFQGTRIGAALRLRWEDIDLGRGVVLVDIRKGHAPTRFPVHAATMTELLRVPEKARAGAVFPWSSRSSVRWLPKLGAAVGVRFTAHMARHSLGAWMAAENASLRAIMGALGHSSAQSSIRYQGDDLEMVRAATARVSLPQGKTLGTATASD